MKSYNKPALTIVELYVEQAFLGTSLGQDGQTSKILAPDRFDWDDELPEEDE